jgi:hypothetical protein
MAVVLTASCLFAMDQGNQLQVAVPLSYTIELSKAAVAPGDTLWVRNVLKNDGKQLISGCIASSYGYVFDGPEGSDSYVFVLLDAECKKGGEFRLAPGARFKWSDKVEVPNVGLGTVDVSGDITVSIWGEHHSPTRDPSGALQSNKVTITVNR